MLQHGGTVAQLNRKRRIDPDVLDEIENLYLRGFAAAAIHRELKRIFPSPPAPPGKVPSVRTVQTEVKHLAERADLTAWTVATEEGPEAPFLLEVFRWVLESTNGHRRQLTEREADMLKRIYRAAPDIDIHYAYPLARAYLELVRQGEPTTDLDGFLAFRPWEGEGAESQPVTDFVNAIEKEWIGASPMVGLLLERLGTRALEGAGE